MPRLFLFGCFVAAGIAFSACNSNKAQAVKVYPAGFGPESGKTVVEWHKTDLNGDTLKDEIILSHPNDYEGEGEYQTVTFRLTGGQEWSYTQEEGGWSKYHIMLEKNKRRSPWKSQVMSQRILVQRQNSNAVLIYMFGDSTAGEPGLLTIYRIGPNGIREIFNRKFQLIEILPGRDEGTIHFTGLPCYSHKLEGSRFVYTYNPYQLYRVAQYADMDEYLSEQYNKAQNGFFYQPYCTDDVYIIRPDNSEPFIMNATQARNMYLGPRN